MTEGHLVASMEEYWICLCPTCRCKHEKRIFWTGRAKHPPVMCDECKRISNAMENAEELVVNLEEGRL